MLRIYWVAFVLLVFAVQFSIPGQLWSSERFPNLFVVFAVSAVLLFGFEESVGAVVLGGLLMDMGGGLPAGTGTLALTVVLWAADKMKPVADSQLKKYHLAVFLSVLTAMATVFFTLFLWGELEIIRRLLSTHRESSIPAPLVSDLAWKSLYAAIAAYPSFLLFKKLQQIVSGSRLEGKGKSLFK